MPLVPRRHRVALHDPIGVVAGQPGGDQREQHRLAEHQSVARPQVRPHPFGVDLADRAAGGSSASHACSATSSDESGSTIRSTDECEMSRSCHSATSCSPACRFERTTRASPLIVSAEIGLRLCGIADEPFWPGLKPSQHLAHLGALQVAQLDGDQLARRGRPTAQRPQELGVAVAGDHLRRRHRAQARGGRRRNASTAGSMFEYVPTAPRQLAHGDRRPGGARAGRGRGRAAAPTARPWRRTSSARRGCRGCGRSSPCRGGARARSTSVVEQRVGRRRSARSAASRITQHSAVSTTSDDVRP